MPISKVGKKRFSLHNLSIYLLIFLLLIVIGIFGYNLIPRTFKSPDKVYGVSYPRSWNEKYTKWCTFNSCIGNATFSPPLPKNSPNNPEFNITEIKSNLSAKTWYDQNILSSQSSSNAQSINGYNTYFFTDNESSGDNASYILSHKGYVLYVYYNSSWPQSTSNSKDGSISTGGQYDSTEQAIAKSIKFYN